MRVCVCAYVLCAIFSEAEKGVVSKIETNCMHIHGVKRVLSRFIIILSFIYNSIQTGDVSSSAGIDVCSKRNTYTRMYSTHSQNFTFRSISFSNNDVDEQKWN